MRQRVFSFLDDLGLVAAIEWQVNGFQHSADMQCQLDLPEEESDLTWEEWTVLFRILQESLLNVLCDSSGTEVRDQ